MKLKDKRVLVTGGAGFIGSHLIDALMKYGCKVRVLDNLVNGKLENIARNMDSSDFEFIRGSITDPLDVNRAMDDIDVVFHLACLGVRHSINHPYENHRVNAEGSLLLIDAAYRVNVERFLYCSSSEVYGTAEDVPMSESHPTYPCTVYGAGKLAGEAYCRAYFKTYKMPIAILRPFNAYGPRSHHEGDAGEVIPKSIVRALNGKQVMIFGDGSQTRDFTYVVDIAKALVVAAECDLMIGKTCNVGSNFEISMKDIAQKIVERVENPNCRIVYTQPRPGDVLRLYANPKKFVKICGWKPDVTLDDGLNKTIKFFRQHPLGIHNLLECESGRNW